MKAHFRNEPFKIRYLIAFVGGTLAVFGQALFASTILSTPFLFIYPACFAVMALAGFGPACASIAIAVVGEEILLRSSWIDHPWLLQLIVASFAIFSLAIVWIFERNQKADSNEARKSADLELAQSRKQMQIITGRSAGSNLLHRPRFPL